MKRSIAFILCMFLILTALPVTAFAAESEEQSLEEIIRPQIEAFAKSIDQKDADGKAADALASHGIMKNGKKLSVGENHALTATIMNSELFKTGLAYFCANIIKVTGLLQVDVMCETIECTWKSNKTDSHFGKKYIEDSGEFNSYDSSLVWMVGSAYVEINVELKENKNDTKLYFVTVSVKDRFDFSTDTESALKDILGFIGIMLFEPFDWESKASFQLEIPHTEFDCEHKSANYHWTLDTENFEFVSDSENGFDYNQATREECVNAVVKGENLYCYNLDKYIRLNHNKPWVFEFTVKNMNSFMFSVLEDESVSFDSIYKYKRKLFAIRTYEREVLTEQQKKEFGVVNSSRYRYHYYGTSLEDNFYESPNKTYIYTMENVLGSDGSNMIYFSVYCVDNSMFVIENVPLDDYYLTEQFGKALEYKHDNNDYLNGKNIIVKYIGNLSHPIKADYFDLKIWENGKDGEAESYFEKTSSVKPTCTKKGYSVYTCSACGYSYNDDYVDALGHSFGEWAVETESSCTESGTERRDCNNCDHYETKEIVPKGHSFGEWYETKAPTYHEEGEERRDCANCGHFETRTLAALGYMLGDLNGDEKINVLDANLVRRYAAELEELDEKQLAAADVNGDGKVNVLDANLIRRFAAKLIDIFPAAEQ